MTAHSQITAPAGSCDFAGRRTGAPARDYVRHPIFDLSHDPSGERPNALPTIVSVAPPLGQLGVSGFGRGASFIRSQRGPSAKIIRASQHSVSPKSTCEHPQMNTGVPSDGAEISFRT